MDRLATQGKFRGDCDLEPLFQYRRLAGRSAPGTEVGQDAGLP
jgi:hypothetical protein